MTTLGGMSKQNPKQLPPKEGALRIWHIPQIPDPVFRVTVESPKQAAGLLKALADYDMFQYDNRIKGDYANAQGLEVYEGGEWCEWQSDDGDEIGDLIRDTVRGEAV